MKRGKKILAFLLIITMFLPFVMNIPAEAAEKSKQLDVLFTHDTHSHLNSFSTIVDGEQKEVGGFAKLKTLIDERKKENPDTLILDGGDFSMGTLIQTVYDTEAAELRMLGYLGCDVSTLGNHEFDYRSKGLADMLTAAKDSGETVPSLVVCNVDWDSMEKNGLSEGQKQIQSAFENYGVKDYVVVQKGDVKIAVVGVFGVDALKCAPTCELLFKDPVESVKKTVEEIKKNETVGMIACVSHSGTWEDEKKSEDEILAKEVPDLDLIISGHTHTELKEPIQHGNTYIVSCGEYARNLGSLSMTQKQDGRWEMTSYKLIPVSEDIEPDQATQERIDALGQIVLASRHGNFPVKKGDKIVGMRVVPLVIEEEKMNHVKELCGEEPIFTILPFHQMKVGIVTTGSEVYHGRITDKFTPVVKAKLEEAGMEVLGNVLCDDDSQMVTDAINEWIAKGAEFVVCTGGMSVDPDDRTPLSIRNATDEVITYGAPVLPGAMFMLAYKGEIPVAGLPGCVMYARRTIFDLVLPRIAAGERLSVEDFTVLGEGGLCLNCEVCTYPNCGFGK